MTESVSSSANVQHFFDGIASTYDSEVLGRGWAGNLILRSALDRLPERPHRVLDLGSGTGLTVDAIIEAVDPEYVTAVDFSDAMLAELRERLDNRPGLQTISVSVEEYISEKREPSPDLVTMIGVLSFVSNHQFVLQGIAHQLRPNGWMMLTYDPIRSDHPIQWQKREVYDNNGRPFPVHRYHAAEIADAVSQSGLIVISDTEFQSQLSGDTSLRTQFVVAQKCNTPWPTASDA